MFNFKIRAQWQKSVKVTNEPGLDFLQRRAAYHRRLPCTKLASRELPLDESGLERSRNTLDSEVHSVRGCQCNRVWQSTGSECVLVHPIKQNLKFAKTEFGSIMLFGCITCCNEVLVIGLMPRPDIEHVLLYTFSGWNVQSRYSLSMFW